MHLFRFTLILTTLSFLSTIVAAQEWKYEGSKDFSNFSMESWIDAAGNSYHNISETKGGSILGKSLLILDKNGNFNGRVKINSCQSRASLYAFEDDRYLTTDHNCNGDAEPTKDSRVFDHKGNLVLTGDPFTLLKFAAIRTKAGYTVFSQRGFSEKKPLVCLHPSSLTVRFSSFENTKRWSKGERHCP